MRESTEAVRVKATKNFLEKVGVAINYLPSHSKPLLLVYIRHFHFLLLHSSLSSLSISGLLFRGLCTSISCEGNEICSLTAHLKCQTTKGSFFKSTIILGWRLFCNSNSMGSTLAWKPFKQKAAPQPYQLNHLQHQASAHLIWCSSANFCLTNTSQLQLDTSVCTAATLDPALQSNLELACQQA